MVDDVYDLKKLNNNNSWIIHYACSGLYEGYSPAPNISCIIVSNITCDYKRKFFINDYLKENSILNSEKLLLQKFADFINENTDKYFLHWNMSGKSYGFKAIMARCTDLGIEIKDVPDENKIDLSKIVENIANKKLSLKQVLMFNNILYDDFLNGKEELDEYNKGNYGAVLESVLDKVIGIYMLLDIIKEGSLKTGFNNRVSSKYTKDERKIIDKKLKQYRKEIFDRNNAAIAKMGKNLDDSYSSEDEESFLIVYDSEHPILSLFANLFLNKK